jgi:hypothetical protein
MSNLDPSAIPALPQFLWDAIVETLFASEPTWSLPTALRQLGSLSRSCSALRAACAASTWNIDATGALDAHIEVLAGPAPQPALTSLSLGAFENREWALRTPSFIQRNNKGTLTTLTASVHCTDTLQRFQSLQTLTLYASEFFNTLYPAVLVGLPALRSLELVDYVMKDPLTAAVPSEVMSRLKSLTVRHLPSAALPWRLDSPDNPQFRASLDSLVIDGAFDRIQAADYAPTPSLDLPVVLASATNVKIEGCVVFVWDTKMTEAVSAKWMAEVIAAPGGRWRAMEVRGLVAGMMFGHNGPQNTFYLDDVAKELQRMDPKQRDGLAWEYGQEQEGIFEVFCLRAWRRGRKGESSSA